MSLCINSSNDSCPLKATLKCDERSDIAETSSPTPPVKGDTADYIVPETCSGVSNSVRFSLKKRKSTQTSGEEGENHCVNPQTKIRRTLSRCDKSFASLSSMSGVFSAKKGAIVSPPMSPAGHDDESPELSKVNSLEFQLQCVTDGSGCEGLPSIVFPHLPVTVSESSSFSRSSNVSELQSSTKLSSSSADEEEQSGDSASKYGWFVVMDDEICESKTLASENVYKRRADDVEDLAFSAPTAPKRFCDDEEAELAWAAAADVVDDVLGDLF